MELCCYLTFNGNCRQAMTFYQQCLGGELFFESLQDSLHAPQLPPWMGACILHASLVQDHLVLMASDMVGEQGLRRGNAVSLMLHCSSEAEARSCYEKLSQGGKQVQGLEQTFQGALFGTLTDKFGHHWLLYCQAGT